MKIKALLRYLPVLSIVLVAGTLLVIVILFTLRNINSQNERMEEFTSRQGVSVIRTLEAGTRTGFMEGDWGIEHLQMLIEQAALSQYFWLTGKELDHSPLDEAEYFQLRERLLPFVRVPRGL